MQLLAGSAQKHPFLKPGEMPNPSTKPCIKKAVSQVDCSSAKKVYMDVRPHDLKRIDDAREQFGLVFMLQLWWMDPLFPGSGDLGRKCRPRSAWVLSFRF